MSRSFVIYTSDGVHQLEAATLPLGIGFDDSAEIRLEGEGGRLAYLGESRGHLFVQASGEADDSTLYHNDEPLTGSVWLKSGDTLRCGDHVIRWTLVGQRVEVRIQRVEDELLSPPPDPPPARGLTGDHPPVLNDPPRKGLGRIKPILIGLFVLLMAGVLFVLFARPLVINLTPSADRVSVSGFPPVLPLGDRYLGLPGEYTLSADLHGYRQLRQQVQITASDNRYSFAFEELPGYVDVSSQPPGASVRVDGLVVGAAPLKNVEIEPGERTLRFELERYVPQEKRLEVAGHGQHQRVTVTLKPAWVDTEIHSIPTGAQLVVDGEERGVTPLTTGLLQGARSLRFLKSGFQPLIVELQVNPDELLQLEPFTLIPAPATYTISTVPAGATISVDGRFVGQAPLTLDLASGVEHKIQASAAGHLKREQVVSGEADQKEQLELRLEPEFGTVFISSEPAVATLKIDGRQQTSTNGRFRLTTRAHTLELQAAGYEKLTRTVTPQAGYSQRVELKLIRKEKNATRETALARTRTGLGHTLILVKPQPFTMGASRQEAGRRANERQHKVQLKKDFYLSSHEVTNQQFRQFRPQHSSGMVANRSLEVDSHPVVNVGWQEAVLFLNWLSDKDGLTPYYQVVGSSVTVPDPRGTGYRLPSEAEWAFAARMAGRREPARYPWTGPWPPQQLVGNFADESVQFLLPSVIDGYNDRFPATAPVGSFAAEPNGFYDLAGNVAEWCHDFYAASLAAAAGNQLDPLGPESGSHRVVRGSSWRDASLTELRFSYRRFSREAVDDVGFRIARYAP